MGGSFGLRERLLLSAKLHRDSIAQMQHIVLVKALLLDKSNAQQIADFNHTVTALQDIRTGTKRKQKTPDDVKNIMKDFQENYLKPLTKKVKNFERIE